MGQPEEEALGDGQHEDASTHEPRLLTRAVHDEEARPRRRIFKRRRLLTKQHVTHVQRHAQRNTRGLHFARRLLIVVGLLVILSAACVISIGAWLRHSMRAALPPLDGDLHVAGLSGPVTVTRDTQGVPSIQASSLDDLLFAQGFVTAQDRLWQMDALRRHAAGELAEILGPKMVEHDRTQRVLQMRAAAERAIAVMPPGQTHQLAAYARGVNAFIEQSRDHLPVEFHLLHYTPAPWTPRDSILVSLAMFQDLTTDFPIKMKRETLAAHLPAALLNDLYPVGSWRDRPPAQPPPDLTTPKPAIEEIPLDDSQVKLEREQLVSPRDVLHVAAQFEQPCAECRAGSNNWAVAGTRSASGFPLVSNDMHLGLSVPDIWYEAGLHCGGSAPLDVVGFTLPGTPFVIAGRNAHVAWSFTNLGADVQDVRIEHTRGSGNDMEFQRQDGTWTHVVHNPEHIPVRGGRDVVLDVLTTTMKAGAAEMTTPVISPLFPSERRTLSLAWTVYDPVNISAPFLAVDAAADGASLVAAFANFGGPALNLVYADDEKHIGYHALGRVPVRGSMQHQPRPVAAPPISGVPGPADEGDDENTSPQAQRSPSLLFNTGDRPHLIDAAFRPRHRGRARPAPKAQAKAPKAAKEEAPVQPPPPPLAYTVGSRISSVPVDALDAGQQWAGYVPYGELPSVVDPPGGVLATANARITPDDYPYSLAEDWVPPYRVERIYKQLAERAVLRPADMLALQMDVHSDFDQAIAQRLAYALDHASQAALKSDVARLHQAADILRKWDGEVTTDSPAATLVMAFREEIWPMLLVPQIAAHDGNKGPHPEEVAALYEWRGQAVALELLLQHTPRRWLPSGVASWNDLLTEALARGLKDHHAPGDLSKWRFGPQHTVSIDHPMFSLSRAFRLLLGTPTGSGQLETGGDGSTVKASGQHFGPSERFTADLADAQASVGNITTGQSGDPASAWYLDQLTPWLKGTSFDLPLRGASPQHTLRLLP